MAARLGRAVRATAVETGGEVWQLIISSDGNVSEVPAGKPHTPVTKKRLNKRPTRATAIVRGASTSQPGPQQGTEAFTESLAVVRSHLDAGRTDQAKTLAAQLDNRATGVLGVSHPGTLGIREIRARATALAGDTVGGIQLYRDVAERWHLRGDAEQAEAAASRAELLWMQITRVDEALSAGVAVIRMRNQIPGKAGEALTAVLEHREWLLKAHHTGGAGAAGEQPVMDRPAPRSTRPGSTWERPALDARKAS
ncbi:hypothetical protein OIE75_32295 [Streptomyces sp. NBC_01723]|uniref:hypothetical protein n=1 Tax=Streptomyces sp. NBC_01723 TaxID=2975921 RepID=UPI002E318624|nr:hypothetical protein [Streptomyces sp. NBC_01723]